jgi:hypothetical protein
VAILAAMTSLLPLLRLFHVEESKDVLRLAGRLIGKFR